MKTTNNQFGYGMFDKDDFASFLAVKRGIAKSTIITRSSRLTCFFRYLSENDLPADKLSVEKFFMYLTAKQYKNSAINAYLAAFRSFDLYAKDRGLSLCLTDGFRTLPEQESRKRALSAEEMKQLLSIHLTYKDYTADPFPNFLDRLYSTLTKFLLYTGCRLSEARSLTLEQVDVAHGIAQIEKTKNKKVRDVFLPKDLICDIEQLIKRPNITATSYVFAGRYNQPFNQPDYDKDLKRRLVAAGIQRPEEISAHNLRHSFASDLASNNVELSKVGTLLGHSDIRVTYKTYIHYQQKYLRSASECLSVLFEKISRQEKADHLIKIIQDYGQKDILLVKENDDLYIKVKIL